MGKVIEVRYRSAVNISTFAYVFAFSNFKRWLLNETQSGKYCTWGQKHNRMGILLCKLHR